MSDIGAWLVARIEHDLANPSRRRRHAADTVDDAINTADTVVIGAVTNALANWLNTNNPWTTDYDEVRALHRRTTNALNDDTP